MRARLKGWRRYAAKPLSAHPFRRRRLDLGGAKMRRLRHAEIPAADLFGGGCFIIEDETLFGCIELRVFLPGCLANFRQFKEGRDRRLLRRALHRDDMP